MDVYVYGNIPNGSGLSSSASLELLTGVIAEKLFDLQLERLDLVKIGKLTEMNLSGLILALWTSLLSEWALTSGLFT